MLSVHQHFFDVVDVSSPKFYKYLKRTPKLSTTYKNKMKRKIAEKSHTHNGRKTIFSIVILMTSGILLMEMMVSNEMIQPTQFNVITRAKEHLHSAYNTYVGQRLFNTQQEIDDEPSVLKEWGFQGLLTTNESNTLSSIRDTFVSNAQGQSIAIGGGIRFTRCKNTSGDLLKKQPLLKEFFPSFCGTIARGYAYYFIFVYDYNDPCLSVDSVRSRVVTMAQQQITEHCPPGLVRGFDLIPCQHSGKPAWAQNDAMMAAYWRNITYFYR